MCNAAGPSAKQAGCAARPNDSGWSPRCDPAGDPRDHEQRLPTPFISPLVATRRNPVIRAFYQRLCQAGKAKKLALTACMRKLLTILNAMLKSGTPWRVAASQTA